MEESTLSGQSLQGCKQNDATRPGLQVLEASKGLNLDRCSSRQHIKSKVRCPSGCLSDHAIREMQSNKAKQCGVVTCE